jgi:hypothetical protein
MAIDLRTLEAPFAEIDKHADEMQEKHPCRCLRNDAAASWARDKCCSDETE